MIQLGKNKTGRQAIADGCPLFVSFPVKQRFGWRVLCFFKLKLALNPTGAYIPHSFYNE
jgi:hypothetical protein